MAELQEFEITLADTMHRDPNLLSPAEVPDIKGVHLAPGPVPDPDQRALFDQALANVLVVKRSQGLQGGKLCCKSLPSDHIGRAF